MRFKWDENKNKKLQRERGLGFTQVVDIFETSYHLSQKCDDPEQWRAIGRVGDELVSVIYEDREDDDGPYYWLVTYWWATRTERSLYLGE